jgi:hypothetical protein
MVVAEYALRFGDMTGPFHFLTKRAGIAEDPA